MVGRVSSTTAARAALIVLPFSLVSCASPEPFTRALRSQAHLSNAEFMKVQFQSQFRLVLERELNSRPGVATTGELVLRQGGPTERIELESGKLGVGVFSAGGESVRVSFEEGTYLEFVPAANGGKYKGHDVHEWYCNRLLPSADEQRRVMYSDHEYKVVEGIACLLVHATSPEVSKRGLPGRELFK
jgi:hypothetical protein